jgi:hypothetical protein
MKIRKCIMLSLALAAALAGIVLAGTREVSSQDNRVATLDPQQGLVQVLPVGATAPNAWETVSRARVVEEGDWIRTDAAGLAFLTFFNGIETEILPDTVTRVARYVESEQDTAEIVIEVSVGAMRHELDQAVHSQVRYQVHTPSAAITVRGTTFWNSTTWQSDTTIPVLVGLVEASGVDANGVLGPPVFVGQLQYATIAPNGQVGPLATFSGEQDPIVPQPPPEAPLAPETCGNLICDAGEDLTNCALDCGTFPDCGNGICDPAVGESPVTCALDCVPDLRIEVEPGGSTAPQTGPADTSTGPSTGPDTGPSTGPDTGPSTGPDTGAQQPSGVPCTVLANRADVGVYVGPGFNRTVRNYLTTSQSVPVVGQYTDSQGNLWYKIQPPGYNPNEADRYWVQASSVTASGDCALVPDASPSQLVPAAPPQPPAPEDTPSVPSEFIAFYADRYTIQFGECANLYWDVRGIREVYYEGAGVTGQGSRLECPAVTHTYTLRIVTLGGQSVIRKVTIVVNLPGY